MILLWKKQEHSQCPLCDGENEGIDHLLTCPHKTASQTWKVALATLQSKLESIATSPSIISTIIEALCQWYFHPCLHWDSSLSLNPGYYNGHLITSIKYGGTISSKGGYLFYGCKCKLLISNASTLIALYIDWPSN